MAELCKVDGGLHVYETVALPEEMFDKSGVPFPQRIKVNLPLSIDGARTTQQELLAGQYRRVWVVTVLKPGDPVKGQGVLRRFEERVVRLSDGKLLAESISYGRSGGDLIAFPHFSSNACPKGQGSDAAIRAAFLRGEK